MEKNTSITGRGLAGEAKKCQAVTTNFGKSAEAMVADMGRKKESAAGEGQNFNKAIILLTTRHSTNIRRQLQGCCQKGRTESES